MPPGGLREKGRKTLTDMFSIVDNVTVDNLKTDGITLRSGNKVIKFEVIEETTLTYEDEIKEEVRIKLAEKMAEVKANLNDRINDMMNMTKQMQGEAQTQVRQYKEKLRNTRIMPDITKLHAKKGLSVTKGSGANSLVWLCRGVYWPKYAVDHGDIYKQIEPRYGKKMMSQVIFMIETDGQMVTSVSTRQPIGLDKFQHYHQRSTSNDCWGKWKWDARWETPEDILKIGKEAEAVLETVNFGSLATENPRGLPQKSNLAQHLLERPVKKIGRVNSAASRMGISAGQQGDAGNVWTT